MGLLPLRSIHSPGKMSKNVWQVKAISCQLSDSLLFSPNELWYYCTGWFLPMLSFMGLIQQPRSCIHLPNLNNHDRQSLGSSDCVFKMTPDFILMSIQCKFNVIGQWSGNDISNGAQVLHVKQHKSTFLQSNSVFMPSGIKSLAYAPV